MKDSCGDAMFTAIMLGAPGAGKGTQAKNLAENLGVIHIASGDLFRKHQEEGTELGTLAKEYMEKGELVPDNLVIEMILDRIHQEDASNGYVLDGFPRTLEQAQVLDRSLEMMGHEIRCVALVEVGTLELAKRLAGRWICSLCQSPYHEVNAPPKIQGECDQCHGSLYQRADDKSESIIRRLEVYRDQTEPLVSYYTDQGKLHRINGEQTVSEVMTDLIEITGNLKVNR